MLLASGMRVEEGYNGLSHKLAPSSFRPSSLWLVYHGLTNHGACFINRTRARHLRSHIWLSKHLYYNVSSQLTADIVLPTDRSNRTTGSFLEAYISTTTSTAASPRNTALSPLIALPPLSGQSQLDSHSTVATSTFCLDDWYLLLDNPLLFDYLQDWEHPVSLFDEGIDSGTLMMQSNGLYMDIAQSQLAQSRLHLPQIDWGSNQESPLLDNNQATISVSIITYPQSTR